MTAPKKNIFGPPELSVGVDSNNFQLAYTVHAAPEGPVLYCKGAPEVVLARCTWAEMDGGGGELSADLAVTFRTAAEAMGRERFARSRLRLAQVVREFRAGDHPRDRTGTLRHARVITGEQLGHPARARRHGDRVCSRPCGTENAHRRRAEKEAGRRRERRTGLAEGRRRHRHGPQWHRLGGRSRRHGAARRQLREHRRVKTLAEETSTAFVRYKPPWATDDNCGRRIEDVFKLGSREALVALVLDPVVRTKILLLLRRQSKDDHINRYSRVLTLVFIPIACKKFDAILFARKLINLPPTDLRHTLSSHRA